MEFEYDPSKSRSNKAKHGIDFEEAKRLWDGPVVTSRSSKIASEDRYLVIGMIDDKNWTAIVTFRGANTRIISVRRSRKQEVDYYGKANQR